MRIKAEFLELEHAHKLPWALVKMQILIQQVWWGVGTPGDSAFLEKFPSAADCCWSHSKDGRQ